MLLLSHNQWRWIPLIIAAENLLKFFLTHRFFCVTMVLTKWMEMDSSIKLDGDSAMNETYYIVKQNTEGCYLLGKQNKTLFTTKNRKEAEVAFANMTNGKRVYSYEFDKGIYVLLSTWHYIYHPKALYVIDTNTYPV